jgi:hypothetical protein
MSDSPVLPYGPLAVIARLRARAIARRRLRLQLASLPRIGGLASIPSRADTLPRVLAGIVPQVERLHLFLHGYDAIPEAARHSRIVPVLAPRDTPWRMSGRLYGLVAEPAACLYFTFDDDILYPADYVDRLAEALVRHEGNAVVGFHAHNYRRPYASYIRDRQGFAFTKRKLFESRVDELGAGTLGFVSSRLPMDPRRWKYGDMDDIMICQEAERAGLKRITLARRRHYIARARKDTTGTLWKGVLADESRSVEQMRVLLQLMGRLPPSSDTATATAPAA